MSSNTSKVGDTLQKLAQSQVAQAEVLSAYVSILESLGEGQKSAKAREEALLARLDITVKELSEIHQHVGELTDGRPHFFGESMDVTGSGKRQSETVGKKSRAQIPDLSHSVMIERIIIQQSKLEVQLRRATNRIRAAVSIMVAICIGLVFSVIRDPEIWQVPTSQAFSLLIASAGEGVCLGVLVTSFLERRSAKHQLALLLSNLNKETEYFERLKRDARDDLQRQGLYPWR